MPTIKVDEEVHRELARFAGKLQVENRRVTTLNQAIKELLKRNGEFSQP
ncbi:MAG: hypothetical protein QMC85_07100 [Methanocellales archaeon]|nr:hypothetical protein [Methanocellales archaeon]